MNQSLRAVSSMVLMAVVFSSADILRVGPSRTVKTITEAAGMVSGGDTVEVDTGLYIDQACIWSADNTTIRGTAKYAHLKAPAVISNRKAILVVNDRGAGTFVSVRGTQHRPKVFNNIFTGGGTVGNLPMDSAGNYIGTAPGFVDAPNGDYHLTAASPARSRGVDPGVAGDFGLLPEYEYVHNVSGRIRSATGSAPDAGAYAYSGAVVRWNLVPLQAVSWRNSSPAACFDLQGRRVPQDRFPTGTLPGRRWLSDDFRVLVGGP